MAPGVIAVVDGGKEIEQAAEIRPFPRLKHAAVLQVVGEICAFPHTQQRCAPLDLRTLGQLFAPGNIQMTGKKTPAAGQKILRPPQVQRQIPSAPAPDRNLSLQRLPDNLRVQLHRPRLPA